jgi:hypothetical protein
VRVKSFGVETSLRNIGVLLVKKFDEVG